MGSHLGAHPWWTEADDAELDLLVHELVRAHAAHRAGCRVCSLGGPWCHILADAFEGLLDWLRGRILRSKAAFLRFDQEYREFAQRLAA